MERHRLKRQDRFAGFIHRFNVVLKPPRRDDRAQLTVGIDDYWEGTSCCCLPEDATNKAGYVKSGVADAYRVVFAIDNRTAYTEISVKATGGIAGSC